MEDLIIIIISLVVFVVSAVIKATKKGQNGHVPIENQSAGQQYYDDQIERFSGIESEDEAPFVRQDEFEQPPVEEEAEKEGVLDENYASQEAFVDQNVESIEKEELGSEKIEYEQQENTLADILDRFEGKEAIIYSEIIRPKYISNTL